MRDNILNKLIKKEIARQNDTLDLIASENFVSPEILQLLGSPLTNKYSEGYPGKRYYPGNYYYDEIEKLAQNRALRAFRLNPKTWSVNVQPYSGSPANVAIYSALMEIGDAFFGMQLAHGGHLTHGHKVSFTGKAWKSFQYGVDLKTGLIDYNQLAKLAKKHQPKIIVSGATAYPRKIDFKRFGAIAKSVGAYHVADISHIAGPVAVGLHPSPFPYADVVMTTTHKTLRGPRGAVIFSRKEISEKIDRAVFPGLQGGPHNNVTAAKALMFFEALRPEFKKYQKQVVKNAKALAGALTGKGFKLATGGTDNHLILIDLKNTAFDGFSAEKKLELNGIIANRNTIPGDVSPFKPSGLRIGSPALTSRGMKEKEMAIIADLIKKCLLDNEIVFAESQKLCRKFPLRYKW